MKAHCCDYERGCEADNCDADEDDCTCGCERCSGEEMAPDLFSLSNLVTSGDVPREVRRRVMLLIDEVTRLRATLPNSLEQPKEK